MKKLDFESVLRGRRYRDGFFLPDYPRDESGRFLREKTLEIIVREEYGEIGEKECEGLAVTTEDVTDRDADLYNGCLVCAKALHDKVKFTLSKNGKSSSFVVDIFNPVKVKAPDFVVHLDFVDGAPTKYLPIEEIIDRGIGVAHVDYKGITSDDENFDDGIAKLFERKNPYSAGKIAMWAFAAKLIGEYLSERGYAEKDRLYVAGHSRLGKTALLAGALYPIFAGCFVNCSGCSGAAISRGKQGETIRKINDVFGYWFTENYKKYNDREYEMPFDQHFLAASVFPRKLFVVAASKDDWADTDAQYLCAEAASTVYEESGSVGLSRLVKPLEVGEKNEKGNIKFFIRDGVHYFSREDWNFYIDCLKNRNRYNDFSI